MITTSMQLDGERLARWALEGFCDETVLVVPMGDLLVECAVRVMEKPGFTVPTEPPRRATLDEVAEVAWVLAGRARA